MGNFFKIVIFFSLSLSSHHIVAGEGDRKYDVQWTDNAYLYFNYSKATSQKDFISLYNKEWEDEHFVALFDEGYQSKEIKRCSDLKNIELYGTNPGDSYPFVLVWSVTCQSMLHISKMKASNRSYISRSLRKEILFFNKIENNKKNPQLKEISILSWLPSLKTTSCSSSYNCVVFNKEGRSIRFKIIAYGDYNNDGVEDMMMQVFYKRTHLKRPDSFGIILTKTSSKGNYEIIHSYRQTLAE